MFPDQIMYLLLFRVPEAGVSACRVLLESEYTDHSTKGKSESWKKSSLKSWKRKLEKEARKLKLQHIIHETKTKIMV